MLDGYNATVFAYGQTGAGKTHTMIGCPGDPGVMVLAFRDLFAQSTAHAVEHNVSHRILVSFLEVYNEVGGRRGGYDL